MHQLLPPIKTQPFNGNSYLVVVAAVVVAITARIRIRICTDLSFTRMAKMRRDTVKMHFN